MNQLKSILVLFFVYFVSPNVNAQLTDEYSQRTFKPYVRTKDGAITYYDNVRVSFNKFVGHLDDTRVKYKFKELKSFVFNLKTHDDGSVSFDQAISMLLRLKKRGKKDELHTWDVDQSSGVMIYYVYYAKGDTMLVCTRDDRPASSSSPSGVAGVKVDGHSPDPTMFFLVIGDEATSLSGYFKTNKLILGYDLLKSSITDPAIIELIEELKKLGALNNKRRSAIWEEIKQIYYSEYYVEL